MPRPPLCLLATLPLAAATTPSSSPSSSPVAYLIATDVSTPLAVLETVVVSAKASPAAFEDTGKILVINQSADCASATGSASTAAVSGYSVTPAQDNVSAAVRVSAPGIYRVCYDDPATGSALMGMVMFNGATALSVSSPPAVTTASRLPNITVRGSGLNLQDAARVVRGGLSECTAEAVDESVAGELLDANGTGSSDNLTDVMWRPQLTGGGVYTLCWRAHAGGGTRTAPWARVENFTIDGASGYYPVTVPRGTFTLTIEGQGLTGSDTAVIITGASCTSAAVAPAQVSGPTSTGQVTLTRTVNTPGTYGLCYRVAAHSGADDYFLLAENFTVTGAQSYSPTAAAGGLASVNLTFTGVGLDSTNVGDSAKLVRGTNCLTDPAVATSGIPGSPTFTPAGVSNVTQLNLTVAVPEGGTYTVCYKATLSGEYAPLKPVFQVSGASSFSPTVVAQGYTGTFAFDGAGLHAGDNVSVVPSGHSCSSSNATALGWTRSTDALGTGTVMAMGTFAQAGEYYMCFTPFNGAQYQITTPLTVSGVQAGGISPTELIAKVEDVITVSGTAVRRQDQIKLVDQSTEQCGSAFPGHGVITSLNQVGAYSVKVDYGGVFTLCYSAAGGAFAAAETVTVRGPRLYSPFSPIVAAVGVPVTFEIEGAGLSELDTLSIVANSSSSQPCYDAPAVPVALLTALSTTLVTTASEPTLFSQGGAFHLCYTPSGGSPLQLDPSLTVKGPTGFTPTAAVFGETTTLTFTGVALSSRDSLLLTSDLQNCSAAVPAGLTITQTGTAELTPPLGGTYYMCYKPYEGAFVALPDAFTVSGPSSMTPTRWSSNTVQTVTLGGVGLKGGDSVRIARATDGCSNGTGAVNGTISDALTVSLNVSRVGTHAFCYKLQSGQADFAYFRTVVITGAQRYSPTQLTASATAVLTLSGQGLDPARDRVVISDTGSCPAAAPDTSASASGLQGTNSSLKLTVAVLTGGTGRAVCHWDGVRWDLVEPPLTVLGPSERIALNDSTPITAGARLQFVIKGVGLLAGRDRVKWVKLSTATGYIANCSAATVSAQRAVLQHNATEGSVLTPAVSLPGGRYAMCYSLGGVGNYLGVGEPLGGAVGGAIGEVLVAGPASYWVDAGATPRVGQYFTLNFNGETLQPSTAHYVKLSASGSCTGDGVPLEGAGAAGAVQLGGLLTQSTIAPLLGGSYYVCFRSDGGSWIALPDWDPSAGEVPAGRPAGALPVAGPSTFGVLSPLVTGPDELLAGTQYTLRLSGVQLSNNISVVRFVSSATGCVAAPGNKGEAVLAMPSTADPSTITATFRVAGSFTMCYLYPGDTDRVARLALPEVRVRGMYGDSAGWRVPLGISTSTVSVPYNSTTPSADVWIWAVANGAPADNTTVSACPATAAALSAAGALRGQLQSASGLSLAAYNATALVPGEHRICVTQGAAAGYVTVPGTVSALGPTSFTPTGVAVPGSHRITFNGIGLSDTDRARIVPYGDLCTSSASVLETALQSLSLRTPSFTSPAQYTICYRMGQPPGNWVGLQQMFYVTGAATALVLEAALPGAVVAAVPFAAQLRLADAAGSAVPRTGGTLTVATSSGPGVPSPAAGTSLTQRVVAGRANFTISLGTTGTHYLRFTYSDAGCCGEPQQTFTLTSGAISVVSGSVALIAADLPSSTITSMTTFSISFQTADAGYNAVAVPYAAVAAELTALDASAALGRLIGSTSVVASAAGSGVLSGLQIDRAGRYVLRLTTVPNSTLANASQGVALLVSKDIELTVQAGTATELVIVRQWAEGATVAAATLLHVEALARDSGNNTLYADNPVAMYIRIAADNPTPPSQGRLFSGDPDLCLQSACATLSTGVVTRDGVAVFDGVWLSSAGAYRLEVTGPLGLSVRTHIITITFGSAYYMRVLEGPTVVDAAQQFSFSTAVADRGGNVLTTTPDGTVTVAVAPPHNTVPLGGTLTQTLSAGVASFPGLSLSPRGIYRLRFRHATLGIVGDSPDVLVDAPLSAPLALRPYLQLHLNADPAELDQAALLAAAATAAGLPSASSVELAAARPAPGGNGTVVYLLFHGTEDSDSRALAAIANITSGTSATIWQGGALLSAPSITYEIPSPATPVPAVGSSGSDSLAAWVIAVIVSVLVLALVAALLAVWWWRRRRKGSDIELDTKSARSARSGRSATGTETNQSGQESEGGSRPAVEENPLDEQPFHRQHTDPHPAAHVQSPLRNTLTPAAPRAEAALAAMSTPAAAGAAGGPPLTSRRTPAVPADVTPAPASAYSAPPLRDPGGDPLPPQDGRAASMSPPPGSPPQQPASAARIAEYSRRNDSVVGWLQSLGLERYLSAFAAADVTGGDLYGMGSAELAAAGVTDPADRATMVQSLDDYRRGL